MSTHPMDEEAIFHAVCQKADTVEQQAYLDEVCGSDQGLRDGVEALLAAHHDIGVLDKPPVKVSVDVVRHPKTELPGTRIGPYQLIEPLGEGGFGVVYLAEQQEPIQRRVALKIIKLGMDTQAVIARFEAERQALAMMDHPHVAKVLDAGATETGRPYFVMELVHGFPITEHCDEHQFTTRERLELFVKVCDAVRHAHERGIIHRDIKPSNVMVTLRDGEAVPKVIDFGIAKATDQRRTERTVATEQGQLIGTPQYMSPEQASFSATDVDNRSDIYSLGVLLYELLVGTTPFEPEQLRDVGYDRVCQIIRETELPVPSKRLSTLGDATTEITEQRRTRPAELSRQLRGDLDVIVMKALEKDRQDRYSTVAELADDIGRHLRNEPIQARPPTLATRVTKWSHRHRTFVWAAAAVVLLALVGSTASTAMIAGALRQVSVQRDAAQVARREADRRLDDAKYNLYVSHTRLARADWKDGQVGRMVETLESHIPARGERDLRGWEWYYLMSLTRRDLTTIRPDIGPINNVKWSADQRYLAAAGDTIHVYDAVTNQLLFQITNPFQFAWSPSGHELVVISRDGRVSVWDADQQVRTREIADIKDNVLSGVVAAAWSPDGMQIALAIGRRMYIWPADGSGDRVTVDLDKRVWAKSLAWHPAGQYICIGGEYPGWAHVWDVQDGESVIVEQMHDHAITDVTWSPDGTLLATAGWNLDVFLWDTKSWKLVREFAGVESNPHDLCWSPDAAHLASAGEDGRVVVWDVETGQRQSYRRGHRAPIESLDWSADGQRIVTGSRDRTIKIWEPLEPQEYEEIPCESVAVWSPAGDQIATYRPKRTEPTELRVSILAVPPAEKVVDLPVSAEVSGLDISPDGARCAVAHEGGALAVWRTEAPQRLWEVPDAHHPTDGTQIASRCVDWRPDGRVLASCGTDKTVKLWDGASGKLLRTLTGHEHPLGAVVWSPDGSRLASTDWQCHVKIWNTNTWAVEHELMRSPRPAHAADGHRPIAFSDDGRYLASGGAAGIVYIWDAESGRELLQLHGHTGNIRSVAWTPNGRRLVSGSEDGLIKIWDTASGREMLTLRGHVGWIGSVDWSPDGERLLTEGALWDATAAYESFGPSKQVPAAQAH
jgi:WD40 repeat protein/serine/threonine protein kinase